jgi:5-(aminomethyl)-3-furanmethanol phosphate kinase
MTTMDIRVVKLGGSLLADSDVAVRYRRWLNTQRPARNVLIVGGGKLVEVLRRTDETHSLDQSLLHWLAIDCMGINARLMAGLLGEAELVAEWNGLRRRLLQMLPEGKSGTLIFDVTGFMRQIEPRLQGSKLPYGWSVTSDSIAARVAAALAAGELVLLKSALPAEEPQTTQALADMGYVDETFPIIAREVRMIRCVNLRESDAENVREIEIRTDGHSAG